MAVDQIRAAQVDVVVLDIEDAVAPKDKDAARDKPPALLDLASALSP